MKKLNKILVAVLVLNSAYSYSQKLVASQGMGRQQETLNTKGASTKNLTGKTFENLDLKAYYWARTDGYQKTDRRMAPIDASNNVLLVVEDTEVKKNEEDIDKYFKEETAVALDKEVYRRFSVANNDFNYIIVKINLLNLTKELSDFDKEKGTKTLAEYLLHLENFRERKTTILDAHERPEFKDEAFDLLLKDMADYYRGIRKIKVKIKFYLEHKNAFENL